MRAPPQAVTFACWNTLLRELDWREAAAQEAQRLQRAVWSAAGW